MMEDVVNVPYGSDLSYAHLQFKSCNDGVVLDKM